MDKGREDTARNQQRVKEGMYRARKEEANDREEEGK